MSSKLLKIDTSFDVSFDASFDVSFDVSFDASFDACNEAFFNRAELTSTVDSPQRPCVISVTIIIVTVASRACRRIADCNDSNLGFLRLWSAATNEGTINRCRISSSVELGISILEDLGNEKPEFMMTKIKVKKNTMNTKTDTNCKFLIQFFCSFFVKVNNNTSHIYFQLSLQNEIVNNRSLWLYSKPNKTC